MLCAFEEIIADLSVGYSYKIRPGQETNTVDDITFTAEIYSLFAVKEDVSRIIYGIDINLSWIDDRLYYEGEEGQFLDVSDGSF